MYIYGCMYVKYVCSLCMYGCVCMGECVCRCVRVCMHACMYACRACACMCMHVCIILCTKVDLGVFQAPWRLP